MNLCRTRLLRSDYAVATNDFGGWVILEKDEYNQLASGQELADTLRATLVQNLLVANEDNRLAIHNARDEWFGRRSVRSDIYIVHLTQRCNLTCSYCHSSAIGIDASGKDLEESTAWAICDKIGEISGPSVKVIFQGGEPILQLDIVTSICARLRKDPRNAERRLSFSITSNGTYFSPEIVERLKSNSIRLTISVDGDRISHDHHRKFQDGEGSFMIVKENIKKFKSSLGPLYAGSIMVLTAETSERVEAIIDTYEELGQQVIRLKPVTKLGRGKALFPSSGLNFDEYWQTYLRGLAHIERKLMEFNAPVFEYSYLNALKKLYYRRNSGDIDARNPCGISREVVAFDIKGNVFACHETKGIKDFHLGKVGDPGDPRNIEKSAMIVSAADPRTYGECQKCAYLAVCSPCIAHYHQASREMSIGPLGSFDCKLTMALYDHIFEQIATGSKYVQSMMRYLAIADSMNHLLTKLGTSQATP